MQIRPKVLLNYGRINQPLQVQISDLLLNPTYQTYLTTAASASDTQITVQNLTGFAINQVLLIGDPANGTAEILKTSSSSAPASGIIFLNSALTYAHGPNTPVYVILYDQIEFSHAATTAGLKSVLATSNVVADNETTNYNDTAHSSGYYFARFKNTISSTFSEYSDPAPYDGYTMLSARSIIDNALQMVNKKTSEVLSDQYAFMQIDNCQTECLREFKRWSFMQSFNTIIGQTYNGQMRVALPTNVDDDQTTKSIYNFRIGKELGMEWIDKEEWDGVLQGVAYTTLAQDINLLDTSIVLTSSADFHDSGGVFINGTLFSYSANDRTTNTLTIDPATATATAGMDAMQGGTTGFPTHFTVFNGYAYFWPAIDSFYSERNFYLDYYIKQIQIQRDSDEIVLPDPTVVQYYVAWKFLLRINNGEETDASKQMKQNYLDRRDRMKKEEWMNRKFIFKPN